VGRAKTILSRLSGHPLKRSQTHKHARRFATPLQKLFLVSLILYALTGVSARAAQVKPETVAAFEHYIGLTEARMDEDIHLDQFLVMDRLPALRRKEAYDQLRQGQVYIEELHTQEDHHSVHVPSGLIHHWVGVIFIPKATLSETNAVLNDYAHEPEIYKPDIRRAKIIKQNGNESRICLQFYNKSIVTVVLNDYSDVVVTQLGSTRMQSASRSTRIAEVKNPGGPDEQERADSDDHGYMWRLYSYWRIEEKDGGVYIQNESITLSRTVPVLLAWLINPLVKSIPHDVLVRTLTNTRNAVTKTLAPPEPERLSEGGLASKQPNQNSPIPH
jgi:hypothetical protein